MNFYTLRNYRQLTKSLNKANKLSFNNDKKNTTETFDKLKSTLRTFTVTVATTWCITRFFAEPILLQGPSMEPTILNNDIIIAEKYNTAFHRNDYKRGDIVVVRSPMNPHQFICKRIVALPGDMISQRYHFSSYRQTVQKGHVWLMGDNKTNSTDSREFGALPMGLIIGRVIYRIWPLNRMGNLNTNQHDELSNKNNF
ncbi:mitochondrial inner membrane protease subunit 1-like protein [Dermatophagoides farinae]|nr:mitochondrial inner membrane protease subunit 1-like protein [Dermatophagoides farinae]